MILSLQGCMAVGKTTAVQYLQEHAPYVHIGHEDNRDVIAEIKRRGLEKNTYEGYVEIQRLWLQKEVARWEKLRAHSCSLMDFGADEIEFYTLNYPKAIGQNWEIGCALADELETVRQCMPYRILFLDASEQVLRQRKERDQTRSRNFFEFYLTQLLPLKKEWFFEKENVDVLNVDCLSTEEVGTRVKTWVDLQINRQNGSGNIWNL